MNKPLMNTREVAQYLNVKERKVYDLVAQRQIPCTRAAGKWLFPKELIDLWLLQQIEGTPDQLSSAQLPPIIAGSHDPLLDWAIRESGSGLAVLFNGSLDGLERFANNEVLGCGMHVFDAASKQYNIPLIQQRLASQAAVVIEWAKRQQGLMVAKNNPLRIKSLKHITDKRFAIRQKEAGSYVLLNNLLMQENLVLADLLVGPPLRSETEVAMAVAAGEADAGLGIAAAAAQLRLDFVPLIQERYDLLVDRRQYFEPTLQKLITFTHTATFKDYAADLVGYDISSSGTVHYNS